MRITAVTSLVLAMLCAAVSAAATKSLTNSEVIKMVKAELPDSTVILAIQNSPGDFDLSPDALIQLKASGVSAKVIEAMLTPHAPQGASATTAAPVAEAPSENEVERILGGIAGEQSQGVISLASFRKTNGLSSIRDGVPVYTMDFEATLRFSNDCIWVGIGFLPIELTFQVARIERPKPGASPWDSIQVEPGPRVKSGGMFFINGTITLDKTEKGWRVDRSVLTKAEVTNSVRVSGLTGPSSADSPAVSQPSGPPIPKLFTQEEFGQLVAAPIKAPTQALASFQSPSREFKCNYPQDMEISLHENASAGRFITPGTTIGGVDGDVIYAAYYKKTFLRGWVTNENHLEAELKGTRSNNEDVQITSPVPIQIAGESGLCYAAVGRQQGHIVVSVVAFAVGNKHIPAVYLFAKAEDFPKRWEDYKRVLGSYVITAK